MMVEMEALYGGQTLALEMFRTLTAHWVQIDGGLLRERAQARCREHYGDAVFLRGLIEISSHCKNDCFYCGIRRSNRNAQRYRLTPEQILECCAEGYEAGLRTFVLQGGEDPWYTDELLCTLITDIKNRWLDCAVTLSLGERSRESYQKLREAGADRYLLRHETADKAHYAALHPKPLTLKRRMQCLSDLKELGYQVGAGLMVGSPGQSAETLAHDLLYLQTLRPDMVGLGPFIPHRDTPLKDHSAGSAEMTLFLISVVRLLLPGALLPATTALGTVADDGWERGILAGANVIMPNLTPPGQREKYQLYNGKNSTSVKEVETIRKRMSAIGREVVSDRGDAASSRQP